LTRWKTRVQHPFFPPKKRCHPPGRSKSQLVPLPPFRLPIPHKITHATVAFPCQAASPLSEIRYSNPKVDWFHFCLPFCSSRSLFFLFPRGVSHPLLPPPPALVVQACHPSDRTTSQLTLRVPTPYVAHHIGGHPPDLSPHPFSFPSHSPMVGLSSEASPREQLLWIKSLVSSEALPTRSLAVAFTPSGFAPLLLLIPFITPLLGDPRLGFFLEATP